MTHPDNPNRPLHSEHVTTSVGVTDVQVLADVAHLPLPGGRPVAVAHVLSSWLPAMRDLAVAMSAPQHADVVPVTVFAHHNLPGVSE